MGLEDTSRVTRLGLTVFEPHAISARDVGSGRSSDLSHDSRTSGVLVNRALDQGLLVGGTGYQYSTYFCVHMMDVLANDRLQVDVLSSLGRDIVVESPAVGLGFGDGPSPSGRGSSGGSKRKQWKESSDHCVLRSVGRSSVD